MLIERPVLKLGNKPNDELAVSIGNKSIEQHLLMADIRQPFYIKELLSKQDWTIFEEQHPTKGTRAYQPKVMVGLILYGLMQGISSLRDLARMARVDLGCIYITEGVFPDNSSICRFINRYKETLSETFFINLTRSILKVTRSGVRSLAGDGTIIEAAASRYNLMKQEAVEEKKKNARAKSNAHPGDKALALAAEKMEQVAAELQTRIDKRKEQRKSIETVTISPIEPEAVIQPGKKGKTSLPAYKPSVLANDARVVVAIDVHPSNEIESLMSMLDMVNDVDKEGAVEELLLDGGYESIQVLEESIKRNISFLCAAGKKGKKKSQTTVDDKIKKSDFKYDELTDSYICPQGQRLTPLSRGKASATAPAYQTYSTNSCHNCPLKEKCTSSKNGRKLKRYDGDELKDALTRVMEHPQAQKRLRQRKAMVEPVFSHLRLRQNVNRFRRKGLAGVRVEFSLQIMAYNISRAIARHLSILF
jgi:transposase